jgi:hypothetical protein
VAKSAVTIAAWDQRQRGRQRAARACSGYGTGGRGSASAFRPVVETASIRVGRRCLADPWPWRKREFTVSGAARKADLARQRGRLVIRSVSEIGSGQNGHGAKIMR